ncbi:uncharacterized protein MONOS_11186 [Monocercomonoides exilis]|uniref:uncharacterized protein n=1 Tax=Monocercomonoides exilis TaxID=2049356 RepID=UPI003559413E|nr:hypothetical protein MONOS_11186 [Monocercomonoides exilis]|eukprot:MONOS_11186.1-p1 / transcript=MONOS_11186.1 / gene=MONOS_11186 / organism=Monocercomonoides_exilis_PA203 / gene_product=unspecified product / transcript_product=unspecified product / location=Mono_scaffold00547:39472-40552(+) / protein_length=256 / sequence_SO=supercontig / SO=protein_coding / is_pseudo=false
MQTTSGTERFNELFSELEDCDEDGQKLIIEEMNKIVYEMNEEEFKSVFTKELFNKMNKMIEDKKLSMGNVLLLLKRVGYCKVLKNMQIALRKEESEEARNEVEIAFLDLYSIGIGDLRQELYLNEIKEIIKYHQEHRNLSHLAYQFAWKFLINRSFYDENFEEVIVNDLHFARETAREIEELARNMDWMKEKEEERVNETKEEILLMEWLRKLEFFFRRCRMRNEEFAGLIESIVRVFRAAKDKHEVFSINAFMY